jgi:hypothetical protein
MNLRELNMAIAEAGVLVCSFPGVNYTQGEAHSDTPHHANAAIRQPLFF